jgi:hypothetical protein
MSDNQYVFEIIRDVGYLIQDTKANETVWFYVTNDDGGFFTARSSKGMPCGLSETSRAIEKAYQVTRNCPDPRDKKIEQDAIKMAALEHSIGELKAAVAGAYHEGATEFGQAIFNLEATIDIHWKTSFARLAIEESE